MSTLNIEGAPLILMEFIYLLNIVDEGARFHVSIKVPQVVEWGGMLMIQSSQTVFFKVRKTESYFSKWLLISLDVIAAQSIPS